MSILESRSDISLLFTDIQMPGSMDGLKLAHAVHDRWPGIKIILVSGQVTPSDAEKPANSAKTADQHLTWRIPPRFLIGQPALDPIQGGSKMMPQQHDIWGARPWPNKMSTGGHF